jgi:hypothetical protein
VGEERNEVKTLERDLGQGVVENNLNGAKTKNVFSDQVENRADEIGQRLNDERQSLGLGGDQAGDVHLRELSITFFHFLKEGFLPRTRGGEERESERER